MTSQGTAETTLNASRSEQLSPYLDLLRPDPENGRPDVPPSLTVGEVEFALDTWERTVLQKAAALSQDVYPWSDRVAEGLAYLAWARGRLADPAGVAREDLVLAVAIGLAVLEDLQRDIDGLVLAGRMGLAKQLTAFRHRIAQECGRLKDALGPSELAEAETTSRTLVPPVTRSRPVLVEEEPETPVQFRREFHVRGPVRAVRVPVRAGGGRVKMLLAVLGLLVATWIGLASSRPVHKSLPEVDSMKFRTILGVTDVVQRPPSLFVTVEDGHWRDLSADQKHEMVQRLVDIVGPVGYRGIRIRLVTGPTVAQWLQQTGIRLIEPAPEPS